MNENKLSVKNYHGFFRYSLDKNFNVRYDYSSIKYTSRKGLIFFKELLEDIDRCLTPIIKLGRDLNDK